ncbi:hypothetical protein A4A49_09980 [Nicotiana attenuata]|uniref:Uncharacterized protein n=1 Tax=Nicotiana attenuata TaxID=49451 RepID=A0A314L8D0_NICAT|nr:hypothetical protein A4A49_09980 [Nicotiana attenuata]
MEKDNSNPMLSRKGCEELDEKEAALVIKGNPMTTVDSPSPISNRNQPPTIHGTIDLLLGASPQAPVFVPSSKAITSAQDRALLDALVTPNLSKNTLSVGAKTNAQGLQFNGNKFKKTAQFQASKIKPIGLVVKRHEPGGIVDQEIANAIENEKLGEDIDMDDDEAIAAGMERVSRDGETSLPCMVERKRRHIEGRKAGIALLPEELSL